VGAVGFRNHLLAVALPITVYCFAALLYLVDHAGRQTSLKARV